MSNPALVFARAGESSIQHLDMPAPGPHQVQVRTEVSSISIGTEGWCAQNLFTWTPTPFPCVLGYQRVGRVTAVGPDVRDFNVGQRVMVVGGEWPGTISSFWGAHVAVGNASASRVFAVSDPVSDSDAASLVVAQVGYNAANRPTLAAGDWVVVFGDGVIGQCGAQAARARGAKVVLVGHRPERLTLAAKHSADATVNSRQQNVVEAVRKITGCETVAVVIDTVQNEAAQVQYLDLLERGKGQVVYSGFTPNKTWADMGLLQQRELTTHYIAGWNRPRMEATLRLMVEGRMRFDPLVTHRLPHTRGPEAFKMILAKAEPFLGVTLDWRGA